MEYKKKLILKLWGDSVFESYWILKIISKLSKHGKQIFAEKIIYSVFKQSKKQKINCLFLLFEALELIRPSIILIKISKKTKIPLVLTTFEQYSLAIHWLFLSTFERKEKKFVSKFFFELLDIVYKKRSSVLDYKKKIEKKLLEHFIELVE